MAFVISGVRREDFFFSSIVSHPIAAMDFFTWLKSLIDLEEVLDFI